MKQLLFLGDVVGAPGRVLLQRELAALRARLSLDWVVVNGENAAGGSGITRAIAADFAEAGVDVVTLGDHAWGQRGFEAEIATVPRLCRPANMPALCPGEPWRIVTDAGGARLLVFTVLGQQFMGTKADCPFATADRVLRELEGRFDFSLVEIHAEATSEKVALGWYLDGRASAVIGTHTHVATADARVLPQGTAYLTDAGMCGPHEGVIGREVAPVLGRFLDGRPRKLPVASGDVRLNGCVVSLDGQGTAVAVERFEWRGPLPAAAVAQA